VAETYQSCDKWVEVCSSNVLAGSGLPHKVKLKLPDLWIPYQHKNRMDLKKCYAVEDGLADSVRQLLLSHDPYDHYVLNMLLMPF